MKRYTNPSAGSLSPHDINAERYLYQKELEQYYGPT